MEYIVFKTTPTLYSARARTLDLSWHKVRPCDSVSFALLHILRHSLQGIQSRVYDATVSTGSFERQKFDYSNRFFNPEFILKPIDEENTRTNCGLDASAPALP